MVAIVSKISLNKEQVEAIHYKSGPILIIAGAGTGKTTVVTERIKYLITKKLARSSEILALTFTEKAAKEMQERVDIVMPYGYTDMWLSTFHAFCDKLLRAEALHIGLDTRYKLMTESEAIQFLRKHLFKFALDYFRPLGNPTKFISGMLQHFSRLQDEDITPKDYIKWSFVQRSKLKVGKLSSVDALEVAKSEELANAYAVYEELKVKAGVIDFGDLITKSLKVFRDRPNILKKYQEQFRYILIDEFQDTNFAQNELVKLLVGKKGNITVVADDDQSIYRFRGAAVSNVIQFRKSFPKTKVVVLTKNYRSGQEILDRAYELIQFNNPDRLEVVEGLDKRLISQSKDQRSEVVFTHVDRVENEAEFVAKKISTLVKDANLPYSFRDFAILVRANNHAEPFVRALGRHGVPFQFLGPGKLLRQPEIVDLVAYLKVLSNFEDSVAFYRVLSNDFFNIKPRDIAALGNYAKKYNVSLFHAAEKVDDLFVSSDTKEKVGKLLAIINKHLGFVKKETAGQILYFFLEETGLMQKLLLPDTPAGEKMAQNISKFFDKLKTYEVDHDDASVHAVTDWLELALELGESPLATDSDWTQENAVNILTVHSSKGLEFPVVFLVNLVSQRFPSSERREQIPMPDGLIKEVLPVGDFHLQEERRLFYVGMTRAKNLLVLTAADYYGEGKRGKRLSPFIFEALGDKVLLGEPPVKSKQLSFLDYQPAVELVARKTETSKFHIDYLSYSQIETFKICPLHFKLKYIYKVPTPPSASQSFGTTMHQTLKDFYSLVKEGKTPNEKLMLHLLTRNWVKEGYTGKDHEKKFFEKGKFYLSGYLKEQFSRKAIPEVMEQSFVVGLTSNETNLKIGGKVDRVDVLPDGSIEIIDYKTGATIPSQEEVDSNLQLAFYALAATKIPDFPYGKKPESVKLTLYFLDTQEKISTVKTVADLNKASKEIFNLKKDMENSDFKCSGHMFCQSGCEYALFCRLAD